jgi:hypothetical protein
MPWSKVQAEIVQPTADFKHQVMERWLPISGLVFDNPIHHRTHLQVILV